MPSPSSVTESRLRPHAASVRCFFLFRIPESESLPADRVFIGRFRLVSVVEFDGRRANPPQFPRVVDIMSATLPYVIRYVYLCTTYLSRIPDVVTRGTGEHIDWAEVRVQ